MSSNIDPGRLFVEAYVKHENKIEAQKKELQIKLQEHVNKLKNISDTLKEVANDGIGYFRDFTSEIQDILGHIHPDDHEFTDQEKAEIRETLHDAYREVQYLGERPTRDDLLNMEYTLATLARLMGPATERINNHKKRILDNMGR